MLLSCSDKSKTTNSKTEERIPTPEEVLRKYVSNPNYDDRICNSDIKKAKHDLTKYKNIFVTTSCFGCNEKPYENESVNYAISKGFKVINHDYSCVIINGQSQGCYKVFIDLEMERIHGKNYRKNIEQEGEKLMISDINSGKKIISIYDLEEKEKPTFINETELISQGYIPTIKTNLPLKAVGKNSLFVDINFTIEKNGKVSNLHSVNWVIDEKENMKYQTQLEQIAKETIISKYNNWRPGNYKGNIARAKNNFRVNFE